MRRFQADLHIHTALSPCAADEMTPPAIVQAAEDAGLAMIAIADHNAAWNVAAVQQAGAGRLSVLAGMEITTAEEVHVLGLFPDAAAAEAAAMEVRDTLPDAGRGYAERFGTQWIMRASGEISATERKMLAAATTYSLSATVELIHRHRGLAIAAHANRPSFSVVRQLGHFPRDTGWDAVEVFSAPGFPSKIAEFAALGLPVLTSSDAHLLGDIGSNRSTLSLEEPTFVELSLALRGVDHRNVQAEGCVSQ